VSRLPTALQPAWPLVKRAHRLATRRIGALTRRTRNLAGDRALPVRGTDTSRETVHLEPANVRIHVGGPVELLRRKVPAGSPPDHWIFHHRADYDIPERFTLEIDRGAIVGDYAAHLTPGGLLDYETSTYFGVAGWREHPIFLRPRLPAMTQLDGTLLSLATRGSSANYYHFLLDVLPRWGVFDESMPGVRPDAIFVNTRTGYQKQLLAMIDLPDVPIVEPAKHTAVRADRLLAPCIPNPDLMAPTWTTGWLKKNLPAQQTQGRPSRMYITRGSAKNTRRLVNEEAILDILRPLGFEVFDPGQHTVQDQIDCFTAAEVIVAPHGAALANLTFCSPGTRVLELFAPTYVNPCYWTIAANIPDGKYHYLVCGTDRRAPGAEMTGVLTDITADLAEFTAALEDLLAD
jgi:capsular polysaccharide biosynthesis protein